MPARQPARRLLVLALLVLGLLIAAAFLTIRYAPFYLPDLDPAIGQEEGELHRVFGYATLTNPVVRLVVVGRGARSAPAVLEGFSRDGRDLQPAPGEEVAGRSFWVNAAELHRLDRYESLGTLYDRIEVTLQDGEPAWAYLLIGPE